MIIRRLRKNEEEIEIKDDFSRAFRDYSRKKCSNLDIVYGDANLYRLIYNKENQTATIIYGYIDHRPVYYADESLAGYKMHENRWKASFSITPEEIDRIKQGDLTMGETLAKNTREYLDKRSLSYIFKNSKFFKRLQNKETEEEYDRNDR